MMNCHFLFSNSQLDDEKNGLPESYQNGHGPPIYERNNKYHRYAKRPLPDPVMENFINTALPDAPQDRTRHHRRRARHFQEAVVDGGTLHRNFERRFNRLRRQMEHEEGTIADRRHAKLPRAAIGNLAESRLPRVQSRERINPRGAVNPHPSPNHLGGKGRSSHDPLSPMYVPMPADTNLPFTSIGDKLRSSPRETVADQRHGNRGGMTARQFSRSHSMERDDTQL